jgi:hypothetical protein
MRAKGQRDVGNRLIRFTAEGGVGIVFRRADFLASLSSWVLGFIKKQFSLFLFSEFLRIDVRMGGRGSVLFSNGSQFHFNN